MRHPDSILPLLIALAVAVVLHAALLPVGATMLNRSAPTSPVQAKLKVTIGEMPEAVLAGQTLQVSFEISNLGSVEAENYEWSIYLSAGRQLGENQTPWFEMRDDLYPMASSNWLASGQTASEGIALPVPMELEGPWFLIVMVKADNAPQATAATAVWVDSSWPADIEIESIDTPLSGYAGGTVPVGYTLRNSRDAGWAKGGWKDRVILSADDEVSGEDLVLLNVPRRRPLAPGDAMVGGPYDVRLPLGIEPGDYRLIVTSEAAVRLITGDARSVPGDRPALENIRPTHFIPGWNVERSVPLRIEPAAHPDLAPRNIKLSSGEGQLTVGQPTAVSFEVTNRSPLAAPDLLWGDRVYWSLDDQASPDDVLLVSEPRGAYPGELPGGGRYRSGPHEIVITPEMVLSPTMYLIVVTDDENDIAEGDYEGNNALAMELTIKQPVEADTPEQLKLGRDDEPARVTVAWIAHDDFQELLARESITLQPILQDKVDPTPGAPLERDPEDTGQQASAAAQPTPPTPNPADAPSPASQQTADTSRAPLDTGGPGELPAADPGAVDQPGDAPQDTPGIPQPTPTQPQSPPEIPPTVASQEEGDKSTSAPRSDREVDPTNLISARSVRPGQVLVGPGLEVKTFRPNWSAAARFTIPRNPEVVITFDPDGTVLQADLLTSTGFENVDGPLLSSLYRWKATGKRLEQFTAPFQIELTILLNGSDENEEKTERKDKDNPEK